MGRHVLRPVFVVYTICAGYYGILAYIFWNNIEGGYFLGVYWGDYIFDAAFVLCVAVIFQILVIKLIYYTIEEDYSTRQINIISESEVDKYILSYLGIGLLGCLGVFFLKGDAIVDGEIKKGGIFLILYQISDLAIPGILLLYARLGRCNLYLGVLIIYLAYAVISGLRYKIILLVIPLVSMYLSGDNLLYNVASNSVSKFKKIFSLSVFSLFGLWFLTVLTLARKKFSGFNLDVIFDLSESDYLYALMAESNIIFGLIAIIRQFVESGEKIFFNPILDVLKDFIPRILYSERTSGEHLVIAMQGLGTNEAMASGTAHPYIGEFLAMFGWGGIPVVVFFVSVVVVWFTKCVATFSGAVLKKSYLDCGVGVLAAFFGYYFFSRGYLPQAVKTFLFVVFPYWFALKMSFKRNK